MRDKIRIQQASFGGSRYVLDTETGVAHVLSSRNTYCFLSLIPSNHLYSSILLEDSESLSSQDGYCMLCL